MTVASTSLDFSTASAIINSTLQLIGLDPTSSAVQPDGSTQTLAGYLWGMITTQGITDPTVAGDMINAVLPATGQFQKAYPGYNDAVRAGHVTNPGQYVQAEEGISNVLKQGGIPDALNTPETIGNMIALGLSPNEVQQRVTQGYDTYLNAPAEVQNYFLQQFGADKAPSAAATVFLNPHIDPTTLFKMLNGAQIRGAAAESNLPISAGLSQRLADMGETLSSARSKFNTLTQEAGLFQQTVGEQASQTPVPGTQNMNTPLTAANQGVADVFGLDANANQQVKQAALARQDEFRGGGGAITGNGGEALGLGSAKVQA